MTAFVDIALTRIQDYLGRSRTLWGRRGASELLLQATTTQDQPPQPGSPLSVLSRFDKVAVNTQALHVDGVISLVSSDTEQAWDAGVAVARSIRAQLPAVTVQVNLSEMPTYPETLALDAHHIREQTFWPRAFDFPLHKLCDECGQSGASDHLPNKGIQVCPDCWNRQPDRRREMTRTSARNRSGFLAEKHLRDAIQGKSRSLGVAGDFSDLAALPALRDPTAKARRNTENNHLATIFADGNGLGGLFAEARTQAAATGSLEDLRALSQGVKDATAKAVLDATRAILGDGDEIVPVIAHIQGGDDVLLTVPALRVWPFVQAFMTGAQVLFGGFGEGPRRPSVSLGVVICHHKFPIGDQIELAEQLLARAKGDFFGDAMSFAWTDVTWDGPQLLPDRAAWSLDDLNSYGQALGKVTELPGSSGSSLRTILTAPNPDKRQERLRHHAARMPESNEFIGAALGRGWAEMDTLPDGDTQLLLDLLSLGRWW